MPPITEEFGSPAVVTPEAVIRRAAANTHGEAITPLLESVPWRSTPRHARPDL